jgi:hypothetical protein
MPKKCFKVHAEKTETFQIVVYADSEDDVYDALDQEYLDDFSSGDSDWDIGVRESPLTKIDYFVDKEGRLAKFSSLSEVDTQEEDYVKPGKYDVKLPF